MSQTKFSIASQSCIQVRANPITSFEDGSNEADILAEVYDTWARMVLGLHPWSFARRRDQLVRENKAQPGWKYLYKIPPNALRIFGVYNSGSENAPPIKRYDTVADDAGQYIASNDEQCFALFTTYVPENIWPAWFVDFAIYALAAHIAMPISDDENLEIRNRVIAYGNPQENGQGGKFALAARTSDQQAPPVEYQENEIIMARFS